MTQRPAEGHDSEAERLFAEWLARQRSPHSEVGAPPPSAAGSRASARDADNFDALCAQHPEHAATLWKLHADWQHLAELLGRLGLTVSAAAAEPSRVGDAARAGEPAAPAPSLTERIRALFGPGADPGITLEPEGAEAPPSDFTSEMLKRLSSRPDALGRYRILNEDKDKLGKGGQGEVVRVWDEDLHRHLAMKRTLGRPTSSTAPAKGAAPAPAEGAATVSAAPTPPIDARTVGRFLEEAQVTGQLDHPGIVPVHELGLDAKGRVYFVMKLVKGEDLRKVFARVHAGEKDWTVTRVLSLLLKVCEAMSYAHAKRVIHRDLKPANIMVGRYGEVFVMDWGLARVLGREDHKDIRVRPPEPSATIEFRSERRARAASDPDSPLVTMDGDAVGSPAYMPPEQASGKIERMGPASDVYALGAMLYHLLTGQMPYVPPGVQLDGRIVLGLVVQGPPRPLREVRADVPPELEAICEKAMAREPGDRYADMSALAEDLRAYLERRVVSAYETGAVAELRKWVVRNKPLAAALAAAVLAIVVGGGAFAVKAKEAAEQARLATQKTNDVLSLSAIQELKELVERADALWPAGPGKLPEYERWLAEAQMLIEGSSADPVRGIPAHLGLRAHEKMLAEIRQRAKPVTPEQKENDRPTSPTSPSLADLERDVNERRTFEFEDAQDRWWHTQLSQLVADLKAFTDEKTGLDSEGTSEQHGWGIAKRAEFARTIEARSVSTEEAKRRWFEAIDAIAKSPKYVGLVLTPQLGLLPIGPDPDSGLWEFWHVHSGDEPPRGADGKLVLSESMGVVLVLIPGGTFWMGAQNTDPAGRNYDPAANSNESPVHEVTLSPYFLSKYELTQGQWERFTGRNPSEYPAGERIGKHTTTLLHPVEQVSWDDATKVLPRLGLELPTEAQWERGARGGTETPWSTGRKRESLIGAANLADQAATRGEATWVDIKEWPELDDEWVVHASVGNFRPNAFGLHDVHGNVWEWCRDSYNRDFYSQSPEKDPFMETSGDTHRCTRGGGFYYAASNARSACRDRFKPENRYLDVGLRPAKRITP